MAVLISPIFMMQVLDRVIPSSNLNTLLLLLAIALLAVATNAFIDYHRDMALGRASRWIDQVSMDTALKSQGEARKNSIDAVRNVRAFFQSNTTVNALNLPWIPLFLCALFLIHPYFLILVIGLVTTSFLLKKSIEVIVSARETKTTQIGHQANQVLGDISQNIAQGDLRSVVDNLCERYLALQKHQHENEDATSNITILNTAVLGFIRMAAQLLALSLGAFLVVSGELTAGGMIGASIICAKTIGAAEQGIGSLPRIHAAIKAVAVLQQQLAFPTTRQTEIPELSGSIRCEGLIYPRGGGAEPRLSRISFALEPGECLAIIGDSGSGKTTLLHALAAIDPAPIGAVFLDDSEVQTLGPDTQRRSIGYLPQQALLLNGTIAENISCFAVEPDDDKIIFAAKTASVHGLISSLPQSYDTNIGANPHLLSAGQKQRIALARAIFEHPQYLFLDEPNALLDAQGERQLCDTLAKLKQQGVTIVMVLHRSGIMGLADKVLLMDQGKLADFGPRSEVLGRRSNGERRLVLPVSASALQDLADWVSAQFLRNTDEGFCQKATLAATEMFNATCLNGPSDIARKVTFTFTFENAKTCNIRLMDSFSTNLEEKLPKIQSLVRHPDVDMIDIDADEMALAVVLQLSEKFSAERHAKTSVLNAWLTSDTANPTNQVAY